MIICPRKAVSAARAGPLFDILCRRESLAQVRSGGKQADGLITLLGWFRHMSLNPPACSAFGKAVSFPGEVGGRGFLALAQVNRVSRPALLIARQ